MKSTSGFAALVCLAAPLAYAQGFAPVGQLHAPRGDTVAVALQDGNVLVASGYTTSGGGCPGRGTPVNTAETFDRNTNTFTPTAGPMSVGRWEHAAVTLNDGRVLIAGGAIGCVTSMTASAEVYNPTTRTFSPVGSMTITRKDFPMARLPDGSVLAFGGTQEGSFATATTRVDRFDPATNTFTLVGNLVVDRGSHLVCPLANGTFLLAGGLNRFDDRNPARNRSAEIYDPVTNTSRLLPAQMVHSRMSKARAIRLSNGKCLIGSTLEVSGVGLELFDPATETFSSVPGLPAYAGLSTDNHSLNLLANGKVLSSPYPAVLFDPSTNALTEVARLAGMPAGGSETANLGDGRVLLAAGTIAGQPLPSTNAFVYSPSLPNSPPTANAGPDQSIHAGQTVMLSGLASYDDNTPSASLSYSWNVTARPSGSAASLTNPNSATPSFVADIAGTYRIQLVVSDAEGLSSVADEVVVSSGNQAPTAEAGPSRLVVVGSAVTLDGRASFDPDGDALQYSWSITSAPAGSTASLAGSNTATPAFTPNAAGTYVVTLSVTDGYGAAVQDTVEVVVATASSYAQMQLGSATGLVSSLAAGDVTNQGNQTAYINLLANAVTALQNGQVSTAITKINQAIERSNGCEATGVPDGNGPGRDWITSCAAQAQILSYLRSALQALGA
jgi:PKD domain